jgi:hypothetical protein
MDVAQDPWWYADGEDCQLANGLVAGSPRNVDNDSAMQLDDFVVEDHRTLTIDDVVEFVGSRVVVELGIVDFDVMDLGRSIVFFLDERSDLAASLCPWGNLGWVPAQVIGGDFHR